jgi:hypothetical protein
LRAHFSINFARDVAEVTDGMRGSDVNWPADQARDGAPDRTGGSRMLLDDLLAQREHVDIPPPAPPRLTIDPVPVTSAGELGRKAARQRLDELEGVARRNLRSAEEARRVVAEEHHRLEQELSARVRAQEEAGALRRELDRLRTTEAERATQERTRAARAARAEIAAELKRFHDEHERVLGELDRLRASISDHDGLIAEYSQRLREEQQARATLRAELDRNDAERRLAERALQRAMETAKQRAEDELIQVATLESQLRDLRSDNDRLGGQLAERDEEIARLRAELASAVPPPAPAPTAPVVDDGPARPPLARRTKKKPPVSPLPIRRKEPRAATVQPEPVPAAPAEASAPEPAPLTVDAPASTGDVPAPQFRRSAMAELTAIASQR